MLTHDLFVVGDQQGIASTNPSTIGNLQTCNRYTNSLELLLAARS
jgi:hypothetical protein